MPVSGLVQLLNQGTTTQTAIARVVAGGNFSAKFNNRLIYGIGAQAVSRKGLTEAVVTAKLYGPDTTYIAKFLRATALSSVASFPDHTVGVVGSAGSIKLYTLEDCQPAKMKLSVDANGEFYAETEVWSATPDDADTGTGAIAATAVKGHTEDDVTATIASGSYEIVSWSFEVDNQAAWENDQDGKTADSKSLPTGISLGNEIISGLEVVTKKPIPATAYDAFGDAFADIALAWALANGTAGENISIAIAKARPAETSYQFTPDGKTTLFAHPFVVATAIGGVALT